MACFYQDHSKGQPNYEMDAIQWRFDHTISNMCLHGLPKFMHMLFPQSGTLVFTHFRNLTWINWGIILVDWPSFIHIYVKHSFEPSLSWCWAEVELLMSQLYSWTFRTIHSSLQCPPILNSPWTCSQGIWFIALLQTSRPIYQTQA